MSIEYSRPREVPGGLRLHLNEDTQGCSPVVLAAIRGLEAAHIGRYPEYAEAVAACAAHFGVEKEGLALTNGLDEGMFGLAVTSLRPVDGPAEAIIVEPAFDMFTVSARVAGGRIVAVPPRPDLTFPTEEVCQAISPATRLIFLNTPGNPTGQVIDRAAIREMAFRARHATVFLDEAYVEFSAGSFLDELGGHPNLVIGRTFSKAYGLAGLRIGALLGSPAMLSRVRPALAPFSVNRVAATALVAALRDLDHVRQYVAEVRISRELIYEACERWRLRYWPSQANFVLVRIGDRAGDIVAGLAQRRIYIRDRSRTAGCAGCVRITAGRVDDTKTCLAAMEELLCAAAS